MKRRTFIRNTALAAFSPLVLNMLSCNGLLDLRKPRRRIFVFVQLIGGNDGLNTLIPLTDYGNLIAARPNLYIPENKVLQLNDYPTVGLHPSLGGLQDMFNNKLLSFVQGVGYDKPNYSHFRSSDIYLTGSAAGDVLYTGWMGRYLETQFKGYPDGFPNAKSLDPPAIKVSDTGTFLFLGNRMDMSMVVDAHAEFKEPEVESNGNGKANYVDQQINTIREITKQTKKYAGTIREGLKSNFQHSDKYPSKGENPLADKLKTVANLIHSGMDTPAYMVDLNGFDTHDYQADSKNTTKGMHADLLAKVSQAVTCFWDDITHIGMEDEVCGVIFSEFGRRIKSNASSGTDHGASQPFIFFGKKLAGGIIGDNPTIPMNATVFDNLEKQFDFRAVYSSILKGWYEAPDEVIANTIPGGYPYLNLFKP